VSGPAASGLDVLVFGAAVWKLEKRSESQRSVLGRVGGSRAGVGWGTAASTAPGFFAAMQRNVVNLLSGYPEIRQARRSLINLLIRSSPSSAISPSLRP
jgi:hypothetical protein